MLFVGCCFFVFSTSNPSFLYMLLLGLRTSGWPHESMTPQQVESLALGLLLWNWIWDNIYKNSKNILGLLHSTGAIIWQSLYLIIPMIHIHNKNNTNSFTWEAHFSINPPVWRPVFNRAQCQRKNAHHSIPFAPWAVWMTLLVPLSFESLSRWLTSAKFNSDLEVFEQKLWAFFGLTR